MRIDNILLDELTQKAKDSSRLRFHYDLRDSEDDNSMRMLNALEPGTVIPVHRHRETSEDVVVLRGRVEEIFFDNEGNEIGHYLLEAGSACIAVHVPINQYHTCKSLESVSVIIEFKNGRYDPNGTEEFLIQY